MKSPKLLNLLCLLVLLAACSPAATVAPTATPEPTATSAPTSTPLPPTPEPTATPTPLPYEVISGVSYFADEEYHHSLDVYLPRGAGPFPTVLMIHWGLFPAIFCHYSANTVCRVPDKLWAKSEAIYLTELGYAAVVMNYRYAPEFLFPAQLQDAFCALAWIHSNADTYNFDRSRVAGLGFESGGHLMSLLGTTDDPTLYLAGCPYSLPEDHQLQGIVSYFGIYDFEQPDTHGFTTFVGAYMGGALETIPERYTEASPQAHINGNEPPFLLIYSNAFLPSVNEIQVQNFANALETVGVEVEVDIVPNQHKFTTITSVPRFLSEIFK